MTQPGPDFKAGCDIYEWSNLRPAAAELRERNQLPSNFANWTQVTYYAFIKSRMTDWTASDTMSGTDSNQL
jgi:hypothetical protein